ncbi:hypothetical protein SH668x_001799 [Planctomicrobium sp. SH668]|uniref:hypothetical protein n=1 Tax=Planctomicrobium sp. SH668 TaxID=3448126 RepID=UPI003F5AF838
MRIHSYDIQLEFDPSKTTLVPDMRLKRVRFDGKRYRVDEQRQYEESGRFDGLKDDVYWDRHIFDTDRYIHFNSMLLPGPGQLVAQIRTEREEIDDEYAYAQSHHDLRSLGFDCSGALTPSSVEEIMLGLASEDRSVEVDVVDGIPCLHLRLRLVTDVDFSYWIAPNLGYSILKVRGTDDVIGLKDETCYTVSEWRNGLWFPKSFEYTRDYGGSHVDGESATIVVNSLNETIPDDTYELSSLEIPIGRSVRTVPHPGGPKQIWDGEKPVTKGERPVSTDRGPEQRSVWLLLNALVAFTLEPVMNSGRRSACI